MREKIAARTPVGRAGVVHVRSVPWAQRPPDDVRSLTHAENGERVRHVAQAPLSDPNRVQAA